MTTTLPERAPQKPKPTGRSLLELLMSHAPDEDLWQDSALCAQTDPEAFFPERGYPARTAKEVCAACPVRSECLNYALENDERFGIWGGLSELERREFRKAG